MFEKCKLEIITDLNLSFEKTYFFKLILSFVHLRKKQNSLCPIILILYIYVKLNKHKARKRKERIKLK
jgi:hypothetical protein